MSYVSDEILMAYADGELTPEEGQAVERLLRADPVLRSRLEPFVQTRTQLSAAFEDTLHEPVPDRLIAAIRRARPRAHASMHLPAGGRIREIVDAALGWLAPAGLGVSPALAASMAGLIVAGGAIGWMAGRATAPPAASLLAASGPDLVATGALAHALEATPSRTVSRDGGSVIEPTISFKTADNTVCREYRVRTEGADHDFAGLACRDTNGTWRIAQHVETAKSKTAPRPPGQYETASGDNVPSIEVMAETMISGEAFGPDDETRLLKDGWQSVR